MTTTHQTTITATECLVQANGSKQILKGMKTFKFENKKEQYTLCIYVVTQVVRQLIKSKARFRIPRQVSKRYMEKNSSAISFQQISGKFIYSQSFWPHTTLRTRLWQLQSILSSSYTNDNEKMQQYNLLWSYTPPKYSFPT